MHKPWVSPAEIPIVPLTGQKWQWNVWGCKRECWLHIIREGLKRGWPRRWGDGFCPPCKKWDLPNCVLPCRMGYAYNGATSVMSSRTKHPGAGGDLKATNPSKQFDKNAYVWKENVRELSYYKSELFTREWSPQSPPVIHAQTIFKTWIWRICWLYGCKCSDTVIY